MPFKDQERRKEYRRQWYLKNKLSERNHVKRRKREIQDWFKEYKISLKCSRCGENHPATIDFHHKKNKKEGISKMVAYGYSIEKIKEEIDKCIILCANCHRKIHWKE